MHDIWIMCGFVRAFDIFLDPSRFIDVSTGLLLIQGRSTQMLCTVHQGPVL